MKKEKKVEVERDLYDKSWDLLGQIIDAQETQKTIEAFKNDANLLSEAEAFFAEFDKKQRNRLENCIFREKRKQLITQTIPRIFRVMTTVLSIATVSVGIAAASSSMVRTYLAELIIQPNREYTQLWIEKVETEIASIPKDWTGEYYPRLIPAGLVMESVRSNNGDGYVSYCMPGEKEACYVYYEMAIGNINIDTEDAETREVTINGFPGHAVIKKDHIRIYWLRGDKILMVLVSDCSLEIVIRYAENIEQINKAQ